jgi:hypothetical protein
MQKMQILMDEEKIIQEKKYDLVKLYAKLDSLFIDKWHLEKDAGGFYIGKGSQHDFAHFCLATAYLSERPWFMDNVDTWLYFNSDDSYNPNDYIIEDFKDSVLSRQDISA